MKGGATLVDKKVRLDIFDIVRYQIIHYCFINRIRLNDTEINLLALMGEVGKIKMQDFGRLATKRSIVGSAAVGLNALMKLERSDLFIKEGHGKKIVYLNPKLNVFSEGSIVINLRLIKLDERKTNSSNQNIPKNSAEVEPAGTIH